MNVRVRGDRLMVTKIDAADHSKAGILFPEGSQPVITGKVVGVGDGDYFKSVSLGDVVCFSEYFWKRLKVKVNDVEVMFLTDEQVMGVVTP